VVVLRNKTSVSSKASYSCRCLSDFDEDELRLKRIRGELNRDGVEE
jgi:hypothetical protein